MEDRLASVLVLCLLCIATRHGVLLLALLSEQHEAELSDFKQFFQP